MCQDCGCSQVGAIAIDGVMQQYSLPSHAPVDDRNPSHGDHNHSHGDHNHSHGDHNHSHGDHNHSHGDHNHSHGDHNHSHGDHNHSHGDGNPPRDTQFIPIHQGILLKNDRIAQQNRDFFRVHRVLALNLLSSPGAGKTALIERMARDLPQLVPIEGGDRLNMAVIVGDLATDNDAQRLRRAGAPSVQITTGNACHLEADMVAQAMQRLDWQGINLLAIENVGNLVCPASYDLGEAIRVVMLSVTEGEDKPLKYPTMFKTADVVLVSKIDVAEAVGCDRDLAIANIRNVAPQAQLFEVSARSGTGLDAWYDYLIAARASTSQPEIVLR